MEGDFRVGGWLVQPLRDVIESSDQSIQLEPKAMDLLVYLAEHQGEVILKERLIQAVWPDAFVTDEVLTNNIWKLRQAFGDDPKNPKIIQTVPRRGYQLIAEVVFEEATEEATARYEIQERLGKGAMGEVHLAKDLQLGRRVALKFLPPEMEEDQGLRRRLFREARAAAALDQPFICKVYDAGQVEGRTFIAMEYVEGQTLKEKLVEGPLSVEEAVRVASEITEALQAAHETRIVHRDIKPSNIMLTTQGHVKVMDFGVAKKLPGWEGDQDWTATLTTDASSMGTLPYMSPEQIRGQAVDPRSDIFSLGVVLYEMLTGIHPFRKPLTADTAAATLNEAPPALSQFRKQLPAALQRLVAKMLAKAREDRYQSMQEVQADLVELDSRKVSRLSLRQLMSSDRKLVSATLILISAAILTLLWWSVGKTSLIWPDANPVQLTSYPGTEYTPSLSPNGEYVAFSWNGEESDNLDIYVQVIGTAEPQPLTTDPAEDSWPTWSSEGTQVAYLRWVSDREFSVHVRPLLGGTEIRVTEATITGISELVGFDYFKLSWSPSLTKSEIAMVEQCSPTADCVVLLDIESRKKRQLTSPPTDSWDGVPTFSPDGETVAFVRYSQYGTRAELCVQRALSGDARCHAAPALIWDLDWTPDGSTVVAALWDPGGAWDRNGLWAVSVSKGSFSRLPFGNDARNVSIARLGGRLVYRESLYNDDLWRLSGPNASESGPPARFQVSSTRSDHLPLYSPDGSKVVFLSVRGGEKQVWVCDSDGYRPRRLNRKSALPGGWSPDSEQIVFSTFPGEENSDIFVMGVTGGVLQRLTSDEFFDGFASWSPDGRSIYYDSLREGTGQIFKVPVEGGTPIQLTKAGGLNPQPHGSNVFYWWEGRIWAIPPDGGEEVLILDQSVDSTNWCVWNGKIVYMTPGEEGYSVELFDPANGETAAISKAGDVVDPFAGLTVSPDGQWILYSRAVVRTADLMLVENFIGNR